MAPIGEDVLSAVYDELACGVCVVVGGDADEKAGSSVETKSSKPYRLYANKAWFTARGYSTMVEWAGATEESSLDESTSSKAIALELSDGQLKTGIIVSSKSSQPTPSPIAPIAIAPPLQLSPTAAASRLDADERLKYEMIEQAFLHSGAVISIVLVDTVSV